MLSKAQLAGIQSHDPHAQTGLRIMAITPIMAIALIILIILLTLRMAISLTLLTLTMTRHSRVKLTLVDALNWNLLPDHDIIPIADLTLSHINSTPAAKGPVFVKQFLLPETDHALRTVEIYQAV